jgi:hypothetical protein
MGFELTKAMIAEWEETEPQRRAAWDRIESEADLRACQSADAEALLLVQAAFYEETKGFNSQHDVHTLTIQDLKRMAGRGR